MGDPFRSEFYLEDAPKGIRSNFFYITDVTKCPMSTITADDNGAYIKTRNTTKLYCQVGDETKGVREESGKFYYNVKQSYNSYERKYVSPDHVILLKRSYCKAKSFPLTRTIISFSSPPDGPASPYVAVFYQTTAKISNDSKILCHGNAKKRVSLEKPYVRTNHQILSKAREFIDKGMPPKQVYDQINQESGGVFESPSQGQELRDTQQVYRQKTKTKSAENEDDEFELLLRLQRQEINFVKTLASLSKSYYVFLANDVQLHDVDWFCCKQNGVLSLDTTFNLCKNWITDSCYHNQRLQNRDGQHMVFLGPTLIHFQEDAFIFSRFASEIVLFPTKH